MGRFKMIDTPLRKLIREFEKIDHNVRAIDSNYSYSDEFVEFLVHKIVSRTNKGKVDE
jgi:hypothetical protein